jgi:hypothetical protein
MLATCNWPTAAGVQPEVKLWDLTSGQEVGRYEGLVSHVVCLDFSPDGRVLAVGGGDRTESGEVMLVELCSGKARAEFSGHREWVECVRFSPDGRMLVSGGGFTREAPGELHLWHLADLVRSKSRKGSLSSQELESQWDALGDRDAVQAYQAMLTLRAAPRDTVALLKARLRPVLAADAGQLARLIARLDSDSFAERQRATAELVQLGGLARPALEKLLANPPSVEARDRAQDVLKQGLLPFSSRPLLRGLRAIEILEGIDSPEARAVLEQVAGGAPEARLTQAAREALAGLARRASKGP